MINDKMLTKDDVGKLYMVRQHTTEEITLSIWNPTHGHVVYACVDDAHALEWFSLSRDIDVDGTRVATGDGFFNKPYIGITEVLSDRPVMILDVFTFEMHLNPAAEHIEYNCCYKLLQDGIIYYSSVGNIEKCMTEIKTAHNL